MKTEEDEAFDDLARKQGMWGGGFQAKRAAAADKQEPWDWAAGEYDGVHWKAQLVEIEYTLSVADIKAALAQPAQEPFGWYSAQEDDFMTDKIRKEHERLNSFTHMTGKFDLALYTAPPKREWVGLTDEELLHIGVATGLERAAVQMISAKLKEKNYDQ